MRGMPLYAVGQDNILLNILFIFGIFPEDHFLQLPVQLVRQMILLLPENRIRISET